MNTTKFGTQTGFTKRKKQEKLIFISLVALALLLFSVFILSIYARQATASKTVETTADSTSPLAGTVTLYTPVRDIPAGSDISKIELKEIFWPRNSSPEGAIEDVNQLKGMYAKIDIPFGEPIQSKHITNERSNVRTLEITPGMRAVTIEVNAKRGVEGWTLPGSRVDVALTYLEEGELTSKIVVENARVLSSGGDNSPLEERLPANKRRVSVSPTVTLEVSPTDALKIETAQQLGTLSLHLRAPEDNRAGTGGSIDRNDLYNNTTNTNKREEKNCKRGKMRVGSTEYLLDCDGKLIEMNE